MSAPTEKGLSALLEERRTFPPTEEFRRQANAGDPAIYDRAMRDPDSFWADEARKLDWFTPWQKVLDWNVALGQMVCGRQAERRLQLRRSPRPLRAPQQSRHHLGRRAGRFARAHLRHARARGESLRQRAAFARRRQGRPRGDLHGHGAGAGHRHARLRENRRAAQHRLRRIFRGSPARAHQRRQSQSGGHLRRRLAPRHRRSPEGQRGRSPPRHAYREQSGCRPARRRRRKS